MKLKNVGFIQQHIEKIVLGVILIVALGIAYLYALPGNYEVEAKVGSKTMTDDPATMAAELKKSANKLAQELKDNVNPLPDVPVPGFEGLLLDRLSRRPFEKQAQLGPFGPNGLDGRLKPQDLERLRYFIPELPRVADVKYRHGSFVLDERLNLEDYLKSELGLSSNEVRVQEWLQGVSSAIEQRVGITDEEGRLRDFPAISFEAMFDEQAIVDALAEQTNDPDMRSIPEAWSRYSKLVTDVKLYRQTMDPETGEWGETELIPILMPEHFQLRNLPPNLTQNDVRTILDYVVRNQDRILQRPFLPLAQTSTQFTLPSEETLTIEERKRLIKLGDEIKRLRENIERMTERAQSEAEREAARSERERRTPTRPIPPRGGPGGAPGGGLGGEFGGDLSGLEGLYPGGGGYQPRGQQRQPKNSSDREKLQELERTLAEKQAEYEELRGQDVRGLESRRNRGQSFQGPGGFYDEFYGGGFGGGFGPEFGAPGGFPGGFPGGYPGVNPRIDPRRGQPNRRDEPEEVEEVDPRIQVVAHDVTVEPGKTYRYQVSVCVLNPLFQRRNLEDEQAKEMFGELSLETEPTEWTEPITIPPAVEWFLVKAVGEDQVSVELWKWLDGVPESTTVPLRPGDPIAGTIKLRDGKEVELISSAAVVDVEQPRNKGLDQTMLRVVDLETGLMEQRNVRQDANSERKQYLESERNVLRDLADEVASDGSGRRLPSTSRRE